MHFRLGVNNLYISNLLQNKFSVNPYLYQSTPTTVCSIFDKGYRYGFNSMEKDDAVNGIGNEYTTEFRQLDVRLGRWFSIDPLASKYPGQSPYVTFDNNPILITDPKGLEGQSDEKKQKRESKRYERLKSRLLKRYGPGDEYEFALLKKASKPRYGSKTETAGSLFGGNGTNDGTTGNKFQIGYDNRKSEVKTTNVEGDRGYRKKTTPMGVAGEPGGPDKTIELTEVKDGEKIYIEATTYAGFRTEVYIDGVLQTAFPDSYQDPIPPGGDEHSVGHGRQTDILSLTLKTGSTKPVTVVITFKAVFTEVGATVHRAYHNWEFPLSEITVARTLPASKAPVIK